MQDHLKAETHMTHLSYLENRRTRPYAVDHGILEIQRMRLNFCSESSSRLHLVFGTFMKGWTQVRNISY